MLTNRKPPAFPGGGSGGAPSDWVRRFVPLIRPGGRVLDLAAGSGRHSRLLRDSGYEVVAVDRDAAMLADLAGDPACTILPVDLEDGRPWVLGGGYDGIVVTNYLYRPLFPPLLQALGPEGILIYETFALGNEHFGKPGNPAFLLRPGELLEAFSAALAVIAFEQGIVSQPKPAVVQRIAAARRPFPAALP